MRAGREHGLTLIELLTVITLLVLLLTLAVPSFSALLDRTRVETSTDQLQRLLMLARISAVTQQQSVTLCASQTGLQCDSDSFSGVQRWQGALLFFDPDQQREYHSEQLIRQQHWSPAVEINWNRGHVLTYQPDGTVTGYSNGTFTLSSGEAESWKLVLALSGRVRRESP